MLGRTCDPCAAGMYGSQWAQTSYASGCHRCPAGRFAPPPFDGDSSCTTTACNSERTVADMASSSGPRLWINENEDGTPAARNCYSCPFGKYNTGPRSDSLTGSKTSMACSNCPSGRYGDEVAVIFRKTFVSDIENFLAERIVSAAESDWLRGENKKDGIRDCKPCQRGRYGNGDAAAAYMDVQHAL